MTDFSAPCQQGQKSTYFFHEKITECIFDAINFQKFLENIINIHHHVEHIGGIDRQIFENKTKMK